MIRVTKGDITGLDFDLVVNGLAKSIEPIFGINRKLFEYGGQEMVEELENSGISKAGQVYLGKAYSLPYEGILHTILPVYMDESQTNIESLKACYWNSVSKAYQYKQSHDKRRLKLAFTNMDLEWFGYDKKKTAQAAISTIEDLYQKYPDAKDIDIYFVLDQQNDYEIYKEVLHS